MNTTRRKKRFLTFECTDFFLRLVFPLTLIRRGRIDRDLVNVRRTTCYVHRPVRWRVIAVTKLLGFLIGRYRRTGENKKKSPYPAVFYQPVYADARAYDDGT